MGRLKLRSVFISDVHLGTRDAHAEYLLDFLCHVECEQLFLLGDFLDLWKMRNGWYWPLTNQNLIQCILSKAERGTRVVYIPGNHDELLRGYIGSEINGVEIAGEIEHATADGRRLLLLHGDEFDALVKHNEWLTRIGDRAYYVILWANRHLNRLRRRFGRSYWSLAGYIKSRVRNAARYIEGYEGIALHEARRRGFDGIVCGHIHSPNLRELDGTLYANCGDWVESCTALAEQADGTLRLLHWARESGRLLDEAEAESTREKMPDRSAAAA